MHEHKTLVPKTRSLERDLINPCGILPPKTFHIILPQLATLHKPWRATWNPIQWTLGCPILDKNLYHRWPLRGLIQDKINYYRWPPGWTIHDKTFYRRWHPRCPIHDKTLFHRWPPRCLIKDKIHSCRWTLRCPIQEKPYMVASCMPKLGEILHGGALDAQSRRNPTWWLLDT